MKLLLLKDVEGLGKPGALVPASDGYARNFLLPRNLAADPTPQALRRVEAGKRAVVRDAEKVQKEGEDVPKTLEDCSDNNSAPAGEGGHLLVAGSPAGIAAVLAPDGRTADEQRPGLQS